MTDGIAIVEQMMARVSNWGRWGAEDGLGTLNHLTQARSLAALRLPTHGRIIACGRSLGTRPAWAGEAPLQHHMLTTGSESPPRGAHILADWFGVQPHGMSITHVDALNHLSWNGRLYNGVSAGVVSAARGGVFGSGEHVSRGVLARAVLLDVPAVLGRQWTEPDEPVTPAQLEACERAAELRVQPGDIVLVRTGRDPRAVHSDAVPGDAAGLAGLDIDCLPWLRERDVAMLGCDGAQDTIPPRYEDVATPVHVLALVGMGLWLIDNLALEELAEATRALGSWEFLFTLSPIALKNSTGIPVNPLAVL